MSTFGLLSEIIRKIGVGYRKTFWKDPELAHNSETPIRVGLLGAGTVGSQTARLLSSRRTNCPLVSAARSN